MERLTAAVVSYNTRDLLVRCLAALDGVDAWVVDNGSADGSPEVVRPPARLVQAGENLGFGRAINLVAQLAGDWEWLAVANADTAPEPGAIQALLDAAERDPGAGALAPRLILPDESTQHSVHPFWTPRFAWDFTRGRHRRDPSWGDAQCLEGFWDAERERRVPWALGAFLLVRRAAWEAAGGFDPAQWLYAEDVDLGWRLRAAGWATRYVPSARVAHAESASIGAVWGDARTERWMAASYDQLRRREGRRRSLTVAAIMTVGAVRDGQREWARLHARGLSDRAIGRHLPRPPAAR